MFPGKIWICKTIDPDANIITCYSCTGSGISRGFGPSPKAIQQFLLKNCTDKRKVKLVRFNLFRNISRLGP